MAGNHELRSGLLEGLEDISEEDQLKMALEMSKNDIYQVPGHVEHSSTGMTDFNKTSNTDLDFEEWVRTPVEDRLQLLSSSSGLVNDRTNPQEHNDTSETFVSDDEDDELRKIIEQSKHDLLISDEEKTKIAVEQSKQESIPMDTTDENEQLEAAIKMSLGATYERLMAAPLPKSSATSYQKTHNERTSPQLTSPVPIPQQSVRPKKRSTHAAQCSDEFTSTHSNCLDDMIPSPHINITSSIPARVKSQVTIATSPNRFSPLAHSNIDEELQSLTEEQQLEMALKMSQEEAEKKKQHTYMSEEDQFKLALKLSRSESAHAVPGSVKTPVREKRPSGGSNVLSHLSKAKSHPLVPSQSSPSLSFQPVQRKIAPVQAVEVAGDNTQSKLRLIVVDGSNVGMAMGKNEQFKAQALSIVYAWFAGKGHEVVIFLPRSRWNRSRGKDRELLDRLEKSDILNFTPSRRTDTECWDSYDDRYIVGYAAEKKGIIVTNDNYRDLIGESDEFREQIEKRLLPFTFVRQEFYPAYDPMGKKGPMLNEFLRQ